MDIKKIVARRIKIARAELDWNQEMLAEELGVSQRAVSGWESGNTSIGIDTLQWIANALGKPIAWFLEPVEGIESKKVSARRRKAA